MYNLGRIAMRLVKTIAKVGSLRERVRTRGQRKLNGRKQKPSKNKFLLDVSLQKVKMLGEIKLQKYTKSSSKLIHFNNHNLILM